MFHDRTAVPSLLLKAASDGVKDKRDSCAHKDRSGVGREPKLEYPAAADVVEGVAVAFRLQRKMRGAGEITLGIDTD